MSFVVNLLRGAAVAMAARAGLRRLALRLSAVAALGLAALLALTGAAAFALAALYDHLALSMAPSQAALIVAAILLALALLLAGLVLILLQPRRRRPDGLADLAQLAADTVGRTGSSDWRGLLARLPVTPVTIVGAVALGVVVGILTRRPRR